MVKDDISEISFYDTNLEKTTIFTLPDDTWLDENGNLTLLEEIEYQLNNYAKKGTIKLLS